MMKKIEWVDLCLKNQLECKTPNSKEKLMIKHHLLLTPWKKEIKTTGEIRENKGTKTTTFGDSKQEL